MKKTPSTLTREETQNPQVEQLDAIRETVYALWFTGEKILECADADTMNYGTLICKASKSLLDDIDDLRKDLKKGGGA